METRAKMTAAARLAPASLQSVRVPTRAHEPAASAPTADDVDFGI